ncbi:MAG: hypothetical protein IJ527_00760 [Prevotella sp.]|nr:hypothetical protein [Prevotella sp.]
MKVTFKEWTALLMLIAGTGLSVAGFCTPPLGEISDSVLWFFAQCLLYAGAALGVDIIIDRKINNKDGNRK